MSMDGRGTLAPHPPEPRQVQPSADGATAAPGSAWDKVDQRLLNGFVILLVLTQRIGVPVSDTSIGVALPLTYALVAVLLVRRRLMISRIRVELLLMAATAVVAATAAVTINGGTVSLSSLMLLLAVYLPWTMRISGSAGRAAVLQAGRVFVRVMVVLAIVGVGQFAAQLAGIWTFEDYLPQWISADFLVGDYNTVIPLVYGSETYKSTAFVLLEPSLLSQFCALAVIVGLMLHVRAWQLLVLVAGLASSVSGTGVILLAVGVVLLVLRAPRQIRAAYVVAGAVALTLVLLSPSGPLLLGRSTEVTQPGSSGYARFVQPFTEVREGLEAEPERYLIGGGAGNSERLLASNRNGIGEVVLYSSVPKLTFEYGLIAGGLFAIFLIAALLDGSPWRVVPGALLVMTFVLSGALLQPQTASLAWVLTTLGARDRQARPRGHTFGLPPGR
ncbi:hypothetical protein [Modestobacter sp. SYSU DS0657]